jgi:hypothetical protein
MLRIAIRKRWNRVIGFVVIGVLAGCEPRKTETTEPPIATAKGLETTASPLSTTSSDVEGKSAAVKERNFNGAVFQVPAAWEDVPPKSTFITAEFRVKGSGGPARLTLSTAGGDVPSNIDRWKGQFRRSPDDPAPKESQLTVDGRTATLVELFGGFQDTFGGGEPQPDSALLGVVIPLKETNYFIKLTGPRATVTDARETFVKFVESAKFKE